MKASWQKYTLQFKRPAGTSRGVLQTKDSYFILLEDGERRGLGECGLLRGLSADDRPDYEAQLEQLCREIERPAGELRGDLREFPSLQAGLEMALLDLQADEHRLFPSDFTAGKLGQAINGLIWMGEVDFMKQQLRQKIEEGFTVLKMKIGAIEVERELSILREIRKEYTPEELELRVDANGAFDPAGARPVLDELARLSVHSIEQPLARGQWQEMARLCEETACPIALDEELIGIFDRSERDRLLATIKPQYIILKPSFIGGFAGSEEWIALARQHGADWWVTSALESNLGLSAIAQWNFLQGNPRPSGLGTGSLYQNNFSSPLEVREGCIFYQPEKAWDLNPLLS